MESPGETKGDKSVVNGTRINVAFPFSHIKVDEPSEEVRRLAALVADLAEAVAPLVADDIAAGLRRRAHELLVALGGA
ncbi:MAG TPA: hypothetical protein VHC63_14405 [Acidimicrobiales bacterium]|nr:hypothetical protein [Acidimicrobiales bacterium]